MGQICFGTGFELGTIGPFTTSGGSENPVISASEKTGVYAVLVRGGGSTGWIQMPNITGSATPEEHYFGLWAHPYDNWGIANRCRIYIYSDDNNTVGLRLNASKKWDAYRGNTLIASGNIEVSNAYHNVQIYVKIDGSVGRFVTKIDGVQDIDFTGDTADGSTTLDRWIFYGTGGDWLVDDVTMVYDDWPGDVRYVKVAPTSDDSVQWEPSTGGDNYAMVDEVPPSDSDYVRASGTGFIDKYGLSDFDGDGKAPVVVIPWARAWSEVADESQVMILLDDGTVVKSAAIDLATAGAYFHFVNQSPPSGGAWSDAAIDALLSGVESIIP